MEENGGLEGTWSAVPVSIAIFIYYFVHCILLAVDVSE